MTLRSGPPTASKIMIFKYKDTPFHASQKCEAAFQTGQDFKVCHGQESDSHLKRNKLTTLPWPPDTASCPRSNWCHQDSAPACVHTPSMPEATHGAFHTNSPGFSARRATYRVDRHDYQIRPLSLLSHSLFVPTLLDFLHPQQHTEWTDMTTRPNQCHRYHTHFSYQLS